VVQSWQKCEAPVNKHSSPEFKALILLLQRAHAGELAAAHAYRGHAASWWARKEKAPIQAIEADEWKHRACVAQMLQNLGAEPQALREGVMFLIGTTIGSLCHIGGWLIPMYGAGHLEATNVGEYEQAARLAFLAGHTELISALLEMAEVEWDHEQTFRHYVKSHALGQKLPLWPAPVPRAMIRENFELFKQTAAPLRANQSVLKT